jgi:hypothetical protein
LPILPEKFSASIRQHHRNSIRTAASNRPAKYFDALI